MTWLLWRQHRLSGLVTLAAFAVFAVPVWITGRHLADALAACRATNSCGSADLFRHYNAIADGVSVSVLAPLLIGVFWGAALIGKELENGTAGLVWTQTTTRRSWVIGKVTTLFVAAAVASAAMSAAVTWWSATHNAVIESRFVGLEFDIQGLAPVGYSLFAAALGLAAGVVWRRLLPAMATTVVGYVGVRMVVELALRPHYRSPRVRLVSIAVPQPHATGDWLYGSDVVLHGRVVSGAINMPAACAGKLDRASASACLGRLGYQIRETYQPASRYWSFQWIEFGIFAAAAVVLVAVGLAVLVRRDV